MVSTCHRACDIKTRKDTNMAAKVNVDDCLGCGACVDACPAEAIALEDGKAVDNEAECLDCGACTDECPAEAISL